MPSIIESPPALDLREQPRAEVIVRVWITPRVNRVYVARYARALPYCWAGPLRGHRMPASLPVQCQASSCILRDRTDARHSLTYRSRLAGVARVKFCKVRSRPRRFPAFCSQKFTTQCFTQLRQNASNCAPRGLASTIFCAPPPAKALLGMRPWRLGTGWRLDGLDARHRHK